MRAHRVAPLLAIPVLMAHAAPAQPSVISAQPGPVKPMTLPVTIEELTADRIARQLVAASPVADPSDVAARDAAALKLGACDDLINAANGRVLWGGFNPAQGYDPEAYRLTDTSQLDFFQLTELNPMVWAKLYLSTFMFPGPYTVRREGRFAVLELDARFREAMPPGEYPYPFWHSPNKWTAYVKVQKVMLVFGSGRLLAAMRRSPDPLSVRQVRRPWDTKWLWTDDAGNPQPRVALYSYLFSTDNPHAQPLEKTFRQLESGFRAQNCTLCHEPDNRNRINELLLLNYPNQALIMRRALVTMLEANIMPPGNSPAHEPTGIQDKQALADLIKLARRFEKQADDALAFEAARPKKPELPTSTPAPASH